MASEWRVCADMSNEQPRWLGSRWRQVFCAVYALPTPITRGGSSLPDVVGYESSSTAGDAACSFNGTAYPDSGSPFQIPINASGSAASSTLASSSATITTALTFQSYNYHAAPGAVGNATGSVSILPITATETFSLVLTTASASLFPSGTPAQGLPVPYEFNGTAPKFYGTPTTGENGSTKQSPFTGAAAKKGDGLMVLGFAGIVGMVVMVVVG